MKFKSVTFTHSTTVFGNQSGAYFSVEANELTKRVDSIEGVEGWLLITLNGETRAVPASKVEHAVVLPSGKGKAAA
ncbi:MAG TPA: hypothetical protein VJN18_35795 [Polyangiaceae bacterium]|nr:hypothetical protein [Polyangiaceae bacterium]